MTTLRCWTKVTFVLLSLAGLAGASAAQAKPNLLANGSFNTPSGTGPTVLTGQDLSGPSAALDWRTWNNSNATTTTELLPSTLLPNGIMIHVTTSGPDNGLYQTFVPQSATEYVCAWIYVTEGFVEVGVGDGAETAPSAILLKNGSWEVMNLANVNSPVSEAIIYSYGGGAEFYVESARVGTSHAQCQPQ